MAKKNLHQDKIKNNSTKKKPVGKIIARLIIPCALLSAGFAGGYAISNGNSKSNTASIQLENETNISKITELNKQIAESAKKIANLNASIATLKTEKEANEAVISDLTSQISTLEGENTSKQEEIDSLNSRIDTLKQDAELNAETITLLTNQKTALETEIEENNEHLEILQTAYDNVVSENEAKSRRIATLEEQHAENIRMIELNQQTIASLNQTINNYKTNYGQIQAENDRLTQEYSLANAELNELVGLFITGETHTLTISDRFTKIKPYAFAGLEIDNLTIQGSGITEVCDYAFANTTIKNTLKLHSNYDDGLRLGKNVFDGATIRNVEITSYTTVHISDTLGTLNVDSTNTSDLTFSINAPSLLIKDSGQTSICNFNDPSHRIINFNVNSIGFQSDINISGVKEFNLRFNSVMDENYEPDLSDSSVRADQDLSSLNISAEFCKIDYFGNEDITLTNLFNNSCKVTNKLTIQNSGTGTILLDSEAVSPQENTISELNLYTTGTGKFKIVSNDAINHTVGKVGTLRFNTNLTIEADAPNTPLILINDGATTDDSIIKLLQYSTDVKLYVKNKASLSEAFTPYMAQIYEI